MLTRVRVQTGRTAARPERTDRARTALQAGGRLANRVLGGR